MFGSEISSYAARMFVSSLESRLFHGIFNLGNKIKSASAKLG
jgi:hypothetical protein